jgi:hypothetical protein
LKIGVEYAGEVLCRTSGRLGENRPLRAGTLSGRSAASQKEIVAGDGNQRKTAAQRRTEKKLKPGGDLREGN